MLILRGMVEQSEIGLVCLLTRAGEFIVQRGDPVAQLCVYRAEAGLHEIRRVERFPVETKDWDEKRAKSDSKNDMDYFRGFPDGTPEPTHMSFWDKKKER